MNFNVAALPSQSEQRNLWELQVPGALSLLVTHSLDGTVPAIDALELQAKERIRNGIPAVQAMERLSANPQDPEALALFEAHKDDVGYGMLVQRYAPDGDLSRVTQADVDQAARDSIPEVWLIFWSFRIMVALGLVMLGYFLLGLILTLTDKVQHYRRFLKFSVWMIPVPFIACEAGWIVAEVGRQPWTVYEVLPTWLSASTHSVTYMVFSVVGFILLYTIFFIVELFLMLRAIRKGPEDAPPPAAPTAQVAMADIR